MASGDRRPHRRTGGPDGAVTYRERLSIPLWWYPVALAVGAVIAAEFRIGGYALTSWLPFVILLPLSAVAAWSFGRDNVVVAQTELRVHGATLPLDVIARVIVLDARSLPRAVGRHGDPQAFAFVRAWTKGGVQIVLDDPEDPTPYWIVSSRHPAALAAALLP